MGCGASPNRKYRSESSSSDERCSELPRQDLVSPQPTFGKDVYRSVSINEEIRGLSVHWITQYLHEDLEVNNKSDRIADMLPSILKKTQDKHCPIDGRLGSAYVHAVSDEFTGRSRYMVSYTWGYNVITVTSGLLRFCKTIDVDPVDTFVWICFACVNQHRVREMVEGNETVSFDNFRETFIGRLSQIKNVVAIMSPWAAPENLKRVWCVYEVFNAIKRPECKLHFTLCDYDYDQFLEHLRGDSKLTCRDHIGSLGTISSSTDMSRELAKIQVQNAEASIENDRRCILQDIAPNVDLADFDGLATACEDCNLKVRTSWRDWLLQRSKHFVQEKGVGSISVESCISIANLIMIANRGEEINYDFAVGVLRHKLAGHMQSQPDTRRQAILVYYLAQAHRKNRQMDKAMQQYQNALNLFDSDSEWSKDKMEPAGTHMGLGILFAKKGEHEKALHHFQESHNHFENIPYFKESVDHANGLKHMGACYESLDHIEQAFECYMRATQMFEKIGSTENWYYLDAMFRQIRLPRETEKPLVQRWQDLDRIQQGYRRLAEPCPKELIDCRKVLMQQVESEETEREQLIDLLRHFFAEKRG